MKTMLIILSYLSSLTCFAQQTEHKFIGNWFRCTEDGIYQELHVFKDYLDLCAYRGGTSVTNIRYQIVEDSLFYEQTEVELPSDKKELRTKVQIVKAGLVIENNRMEITSLWEGQVVTSSWKRLNEEIKKFIPPKRPKRKLDTTNELFYKELVNRAKINACVDLRNKEQIEATCLKEQNKL